MATTSVDVHMPFPPWWSTMAGGAGRSEQSGVPLGDGNILEALQTLYLRPDVRASVIAMTPIFTEMLSRDAAAAQALNEIVGGLPLSGSETERLPALVIYGLIAAGGAAVGWLSRP